MLRTGFILMVLAICMICCKKRESTDEDLNLCHEWVAPSSSANMVKSFTYGSGPSFRSSGPIYYDGQLRILKGSGRIYCYGEGVIDVTENDALKIKLELSADGLVSKAVYSGDSSHPWNRTYTYDNNGYLIRMTQVDYTLNMYYDADSNLIAREGLNSSGARKNLYCYTYSDIISTVGYENMGQRFWGKSSRHLPITERELYITGLDAVPDTVNDNTTNIIYQFDSYNRVISSSNFKTYTYY